MEFTRIKKKQLEVRLYRILCESSRTCETLIVGAKDFVLFLRLKLMSN